MYIPRGIYIVSVLLLSGPTMASPFTNPKRWGDMFMVMPTAYALGIAATYEDYSGMLQLGGSIISAQLTAEGIKHIVREERPNKADKLSFPSGHAVGAFSGAMYVHKRYGWRPAILPYAFSIITGYSRVYAKAHYWHDVLGGALLSAFFTWTLVSEYSNKIDLNVSSDGASLRFKTTF